LQIEKHLVEVRVRVFFDLFAQPLIISRVIFFLHIPICAAGNKPKLTSKRRRQAFDDIFQKELSF
jgi:hypothetical protein